jgi:hypothetical protein
MATVSPMPKHPEDLPTALPSDDWVARIDRTGEPFDLGVSAVDLVAEARAEMGWDNPTSGSDRTGVD